MARARWWLRALVFLALVGVGGWPSAGVEAGFSRVLSGLGNLCFRSWSALPAELELVPLGAARERSAGENVHADTQLVLHVPGASGAVRLGLSLRRDAYLPLLIFVAATLVLPLSRPARLACLALGVPIVLTVAIASVAVLVLFLLSLAPVAGVAPWQGGLSGFLYECWLTPPGNRVIAPLLLAALLGFSGRASGARVVPWRAGATG